jgi:hypothetical protein
MSLVAGFCRARVWTIKVLILGALILINLNSSALVVDSNWELVSSAAMEGALMLFMLNAEKIWLSLQLVELFGFVQDIKPVDLRGWLKLRMIVLWIM